MDWEGPEQLTKDCTSAATLFRENHANQQPHKADGGNSEPLTSKYPRLQELRCSGGTATNICDHGTSV